MKEDKKSSKKRKPGSEDIDVQEEKSSKKHKREDASVVEEKSIQDKIESQGGKNGSEEFLKNKEDTKTEDDDQDTSNEAPKRGRKRKKRFYKNLVTQIEFYFSDANLTKSKYMQDLLRKSPWVDLSVFMKFNKLTGMLQSSFDRVDQDDLWKALNAIESDLLEVKESKDGRRQVKRVKPLKKKDKEEEESCTIYLENIPEIATIDMIRQHFQQYGKVDYVSLPRFKFNQQIKGFAFVEFEKKESADKALEAYGTLDEEQVQLCPENLQSIQSFNKEKEIEEKSNQFPEGKNGNQNAQRGEGDDGEEGLPAKRQKLDVDEKKSDKTSSSEEETDGHDGDKAQKKKKKRRKKNKNCTGPIGPSLELVMMSSLRVISKTKWRKLRNTYLNLQRKNMGEAKRYFQHENSKPVKSYKSQMGDEKNAKTDTKNDIKFVPNTIVKFTVNEPIASRETIKKKVNSVFIEPVTYVDAEVGHSVFHVRCASEEQAKKLCDVKSLGDGVVLSGKDEQEYWERIREHRSKKLGEKSQKVQKQNVRGKTKLMSKISEAQGTHKYFDEDE